MAIDRLLLYVFFGVTLGGTLGILLSAPDIFDSVDQVKELQRLTHMYQTSGQEMR
jgi:nicotinic acetylcholine receptor